MATSSSLSPAAAARPHIIALPFPLPGHISPLLHLCKILVVSARFSVTFVVTSSCHSKAVEMLSEIQQQQHDDNHFDEFGIRLLSIPDHLSPEPSYEEIRQWHLTMEELRWAFEALVERHFTSLGFPFACILSDAHLAWAQDVADKFGVPRVAFWVGVAAECQLYTHAPRLISAGVLPFKAPVDRCSPDDLDNLEPGGSGKRPIFHRVCSPQPLDERIYVPGLPQLDRRDFPALLQIEDSSDIFSRYYLDQTKRISEAYMVLFNSFLALEASAFASMREKFNAHALGPLFLLMEKLTPKPKHNLSEEQDSCLRWLDKQPKNSVLYVASGSTIAPSPAQVAALAKGLEASQQNFLWALFNTDSGQPGPFPEGFLDRTKGRGLVVAWAPQRLVLGHPSIGGFLTACGWNSVLESISLGVPMIGLPQRADHFLICKLLVDEFGVGMRLEQDREGYVSSEDVERVARELMEGERGEKLRRTAEEWSRAAQRAVDSGGSSLQSLKMVVEKLKLLNSTRPICEN